MDLNKKIEKRFENISKSKTFLNIVRTFTLDKKKVLDIGCTYGEFLVHFGKGSTGITIVQDEVAYGKEKGLDIRYGNIEADNFVLTETYEIIFANNLLEHLYAPHHFLRKIKAYLRPGGRLILGVPCIPKIVPLLRLNKFRGSLAVSHINFYTRDTLIKTVERAGWSVLGVRGFRFTTAAIDHFLDPIYPHFYVIAIPGPDFHHLKK